MILVSGLAPGPRTHSSGRLSSLHMAEIVGLFRQFPFLGSAGSSVSETFVFFV